MDSHSVVAAGHAFCGRPCPCEGDFNQPLVAVYVTQNPDKLPHERRLALSGFPMTDSDAHHCSNILNGRAGGEPGQGAGE